MSICLVKALDTSGYLTRSLGYSFKKIINKISRMTNFKYILFYTTWPTMCDSMLYLCLLCYNPYQTCGNTKMSARHLDWQIFQSARPNQIMSVRRKKTDVYTVESFYCVLYYGQLRPTNKSPIVHFPS